MKKQQSIGILFVIVSIIAIIYCAYKIGKYDENIRITLKALSLPEKQCYTPDDINEIIIENRKKK